MHSSSHPSSNSLVLGPRCAKADVLSVQQGQGPEYTEASRVTLRWLGRTVGRRLVEYRFPLFGCGCLLFTLVSLEGERGLVHPYAIFGQQQQNINNQHSLTRSLEQQPELWREVARGAGLPTFLSHCSILQLSNLWRREGLPPWVV